RALSAAALPGAPPPRGGEFAPRPMAWAIVVGTIPAGLAGLFAKHWIETYLRTPVVIPAPPSFYGLLLLLGDQLGRKERTVSRVTLVGGLVVGCAQALALVPGT